MDQSAAASCMIHLQSGHRDVDVSAAGRDAASGPVGPPVSELGEGPNAAPLLIDKNKCAFTLESPKV